MNLSDNPWILWMCISMASELNVGRSLIISNMSEWEMTWIPSWVVSNHSGTLKERTSDMVPSQPQFKLLLTYLSSGHDINVPDPGCIHPNWTNGIFQCSPIIVPDFRIVKPFGFWVKAVPKLDVFRITTIDPGVDHVNGSIHAPGPSIWSRALQLSWLM